MTELKRLERAKCKIADKAERLICEKIQRYCKRYNSSVDTLYGTTVENKNGTELIDTAPEKWIKYFEDNFGPFGFYKCVKGNWMRGETPLIKFDKPY